MTKKVSFGMKTSHSGDAKHKIDEWVENHPSETKQELETPPIRMKRFTIDIPFDLHTRIKSQCALRGVTMNTEIIALLEKHFQ